LEFLADENFNNDILQGIWRIQTDVLITRAQDTEVYQAKDPDVLEFAAQHGYILLTHDVSTMRDYAYDRVAKGLSMPGVFVVSQDVPVKRVIDDLLMIYGASDPSEWENRVEFLPL
jgi:hypothetical protein